MAAPESKTPAAPPQTAFGAGATDSVQGPKAVRRSAGVVVWHSVPADETNDTVSPVKPGAESERSRVALVLRQGQWCLPRVFCQEDEPGPVAARRAACTQVSPNLDRAPLTFLGTLREDLLQQPLQSEYWRLVYPRDGDTHVPHAQGGLLAHCSWHTLTEALDLIAFREERSLLESMDDPLAHPPSLLPKAKETATAHGEEDASRKAATLNAGRQLLEQDSVMGAERAKVQNLLAQARASRAAGQGDDARIASAAAWKMDFESRSVSERRLMTRLLQGEVRAQTEGWRRDALLTALEESSDAGALAMVRAELETLDDRTKTAQEAKRFARLIQLTIAVPFAIALLFNVSNSWLSGAAPVPAELLPAVLGLGMLGGLAWSVLRQVPTEAITALAPLGIGAFGALIGFLLQQAGIVHFGPDSAPWALCLAAIWGALAALVLEFKRPKAASRPSA